MITKYNLNQSFSLPNKLPISKMSSFYDFETERMVRAIDSCEDIDALKELFKEVIRERSMRIEMHNSIVKELLGEIKQNQNWNTND